jgi:vacuolar-type H+-ATPase subunit C/Vma6
MISKELSHYLAEEDYTYLSGFLKAKEVRFLKTADFVTMSRFMALQELFEFLPKFGYHVKANELDPITFENNLWESFEADLAGINRLEPEPFLSNYLENLQKIFFWKPDLSSFSTFATLSKHGSDFTRKILGLVIDRYNFFEKIRSIHDQSSSWIFENGGFLTKNTIDQLFDSSFQSLDLGISYDVWKEFIDKESPVQEFDFSFTSRLDVYWKSTLEEAYLKVYYQTYGLDFCISYFLKWMLEIEAITKVYFTLRFSLHNDLREELYLHVR